MMARRLTDEEKAEMVRLRGEGMSYRDIGSAVGLSESGARLYLVPGERDKAAERQRQHIRKHPGKGYRLSEDEVGCIKRMRQSGVPMRAIAERIGCSGGTVLRWSRAASRDNANRLCTKYNRSHREELRTYGRAYHAARLVQDQIYKNQQYTDNIQYKLAACLRSRLRSAIANGQRRGSAVRDLGCTIAELKAHLESQFQPGMAWENWAFGGWHIDHIIPLAAFDLTDRTQFLEACSYRNLRPMWGRENMAKGAKMPEEVGVLV